MSYLTEVEIEELVNQHYGGKNAIDRESAKELVRKVDKQITSEISEKVQKIRDNIREGKR